ncbi:ABC transporter permease [Bacillus nakamurai]|uniref:ABC transporter permease n=1 Tax=Bacillus nakamurai TaxID=1793963 RepID=A0A150FC21_9BACI|nr:hypothetical protein [Bacillus nakamurai]KXZ23215.1 ABC transporter permease [Bacillus nakamurai]MED1228011.1 ABC transporter permease [Bacillus nakamurai]
MIDRGLLYKEWKQNQIVLILIACYLAFSNVLYILSMYLTYKGCLNNPLRNGCIFNIDYLSITFASFNWIPAIMIAVFQLGVERNKGSLEFTIGLPYSRGQVYCTKLMLGSLTLVLPQAIGYVLSYWSVLLLKPAHADHFHHFTIGMIIITILAYALVMASGSLTGNIFAQLLVAFTVSVSFFIFIYVPTANVEIIFGIRSFLYYRTPDWIQFSMPIIYIYPEWVSKSEILLVIPAVMSILFFLLGYISFVKSPVERNGHFFLWKKLDRPIQILVIIIGILGFGYFGYSTEQSIIGYLFGMIFGGVCGFIISYFTIYKKTKHV